MTILVDWQIAEQCRSGMITPFDPDLVNPASLDLRLGDTLLIESVESPDLKPYPLGQHTEADPYWLRPGQFVLGHTVEQFSIPTRISAQFLLKSSRAREGLNHLLAGYCDPGWHGSVLTLELHNVRQLHSVPLWPGMRIGQMVFHALDSVPGRSYAEVGRYCNDTTVQASRG
jgi:dCTP deaminase